MDRWGRRRSRYRRFHGGPDPLAPPVDPTEALRAIADDVMAGRSPEAALREYLRRGDRPGRGLDDLAARLNRQRRQHLDRNRLGGTLDEVRELLDRAVLTERRQLARDLDDDARFAELQLAELPDSTAAAVRDLADYRWRSPEAEATYRQIGDLLGREELDQRFAGMKQALENADDADRAAVSKMLTDLNGLLAAHARGEDTAARFAAFMADHGHLFPENPRTVEELIDALAARAAAAQRMRQSMSPEQRAELDALAQQAFGTPELTQQLAELDATLQGLRPDAGWGESEQFGGDQPLGSGEATSVLAELAELDALSEQLAQNHAGARTDDIDLDLVERHLGSEAVVTAQTLAEIERMLRNEGLLVSDAQGGLQLSPAAMRQLGRTLLGDVTDRLAGRTGQRDVRQGGLAGEPSGATRAWEFGDTQSWDVSRTLMNARLRRAADPGAPELALDDIEVVETEARTRAAVALLVDTSFSMAMEGRWVPMKRTALALHHLISTRFRNDALELITFSRYAQVTDVAQLTGLPPQHNLQGTNLHHALLLANRFFASNPTAQPVLLVVTDGEPTAHLEPDGEAFFWYPPLPETIAAAVTELDEATRRRTRITIFRLGHEPALVEFCDQLARRSGGKVVAPEVDDLDEAVVASYLRRFE
ncbi:vWA domain-containing protein [Propionibacteriaceae bacterium Y2011]